MNFRIGPRRLPLDEGAEESDPQKATPKWFLWILIACLLPVLGFFVGRYIEFQTKDQQRIEAALADTPSKYGARLAERVAFLEAQVTQLGKAVNELSDDTKKQSAATNALTFELKTLNEELKRLREGRK